MNKKTRYLILVSIAIISIGMHYTHFPKELISIHSWRQTQTQSTILSFYEEDMNILNPRRNDRGNGDGIFRMEFPLMQWMVAGTYGIFGNHLIITRIFMFISGLFSIFGLYIVLKYLFRNEVLALIGAWTFNFSPSFYYYTINPLPDNFALCCSLWGVAFFFVWHRKKRIGALLLSGVFLGLGALCKLPFILYFSLPFSYFIIQFFHSSRKSEVISKAGIIHAFILLPAAWYAYVIPQWHGNGIVKGMAENSVPLSDLLDYLQHNVFSTLPELLLNYGSVPFFVMAFYYILHNNEYKKKYFAVFVIWSLSIVFYFLFELNMIAKIHDYYLFPFYPLLFILVSYGAYNLLETKKKIVTYVVLFLLLVLPITAYLRMKVRWDIESPGFNKDLLVYKNELRNAVPKNSLCIAGNDESHFIFFYYIDKKGWGFDNNNLNKESLATMIEQGAQYIYTDSRSLVDNKDISHYFGELIAEKGSIRVYRLKNK